MTKEETIKLNEKEIEEKIIKLAEKGLTAEKIGEALRKENIHTKESNIKISKVLKKAKIYQDPDLKNVEEKLNKIKAHYDKNHQDKRAMREKDRIFAHLRLLKKYNSK